MSGAVRPCRGPDYCMDDLCVHSDQGICGVWRDMTLGVDDSNDYPDDEWEFCDRPDCHQYHDLSKECPS